MSKDANGGSKAYQHEVRQRTAAAGSITIKAGRCGTVEEQAENEAVELLAMEELVPISQTLITPTLAGLFNLAVADKLAPQLLVERRSKYERSLFDNHHEDQLQQVRRGAMDGGNLPVFSSKASGHADDLQMMMMMSTFCMNQGTSRDPTTSHYKRPRMDAGLIDCSSYGDDSAEGFDTNHIVTDRPENSSNSGDGADAGSGGGGGSGSGGSGGAARTLKRPRLVWTPQLHKRFVDAVSHLGIKNAVPKTIMQLMNVEGLTRENVASHLQKYRLYLRRVQQQGNMFSSCHGRHGGSTPTSSNKAVLSSPGFEHRHHQPRPLSPIASSDHHLFSPSYTISHQVCPDHQHPRPATAPNPHNNPELIPQNLLLHQPHHHHLHQQQGNIRAMAKASPFTHRPGLNAHLYNGITIDPFPDKQRYSAWLSSPQAASKDRNYLHHLKESHADLPGTSSGASASSPKRVLTLFPH